MTFIIAEVGVNHDGLVGNALDLINAADLAGADAVKFQAFNPDLLAKPGSAAHDMLRTLHFGSDDLKFAAERCNDLSIEFMCTPFDVENLRLVLELGVDRIKVSSQSVTNLELIRAIGVADRPVILSTGMATDEQVEAALDLLTAPVTLMYCVSKYPAPEVDVHLSEMYRMREKFGLPVGYSDHTGKLFTTVAAAALGATMVEAHITKSRKKVGPDHASSLEVGELCAWVREVKAAGEIYDGHKAKS